MGAPAKAYVVMRLRNDSPGYVSGTLGAPACIDEGLYALVPITEEQAVLPPRCGGQVAVLRVEEAEFDHHEWTGGNKA